MKRESVRYSKAPITEALIDLRVTQAQDFHVSDLEAIGERIGDLYTIRETMQLYSGQWTIQATGEPMHVKAAHQLDGFRFTHQDMRQSLQARFDGFTFSTFAPYAGWKAFRDEARRLWELYRSVSKVEGVTRAAVRYINQIDIPTNPMEPEDYLRTYPQVSTDMPKEGLINNYFLQLQQWQEDLDCMLIVNEAPVPPPDQGITSIQLDFDLFREEFESPWQADKDVALWEFLEQLHDRKNEVFQASITEETRRLIR